jgi:hypothetical protein
LNLTKTAAQLQQQQQSGDAASAFAAPGAAAAGGVAAGSAYERIMEQYEVKCEAVLTSVYQSMFKVSRVLLCSWCAVKDQAPVRHIIADNRWETTDGHPLQE